MIHLKTPQEIEIMSRGGAILASILKKLEAEAKPGITTKELDFLAESLIFDCGGQPSFKGEGGYPATTCISVNEEVVHGVPSPKKIIHSGDIVSIDVGMVYEGFHTDTAATVAVGDVDPEMRRMIKVAKKSLKYAAKKAHPGNTFGDIGNTIERFVESQGFHVVRDLCGHGIGRRLHEDPQILNYGRRHKGPAIKEGMVFCVEPMITAGNPSIALSANGQTYCIKDGHWAAHFEHTFAVFAEECRILTKTEDGLFPEPDDLENNGADF